LTPDMVGSEWHTLSFAQSYSDAVLLAGIQTFDGSDPAALRYKNLTASGAEIKVEEEASGDSEVAHTTEVVGYLVFEDPGASGGGSDPPAAPTGLNPDNGQTFPSGSSVTMSSNPIADATEYEFDIEWLDGNAWAHYYTYFTATSAKTFSPAFDNKPYRWRVRARNAVGWGAWSDWATFDFGTVSRVPAAPTGLSPDNGQRFPSGSSVTMSSNPITGASDYDFEIDYSSGGTWKDYYTYTGKTHSRTFWPVYNNTSYRWRVRAKNASGWGEWSVWATFDMGTVSSVPAVPTGLSPNNGQTITTKSVTMSVNALSGATQFEFKIEHLSGAEWKPYYTYSTSTNSQTFWPVYQNRSYRFEVRAQNAHGWSAWSGWATFYFSP
ncbi:MAG: fibronectin type III domain-containing protein, partial [Gemmatimonadetes bacterium]|nr:fibronectin type III domain-containing protein [Gemmatimonadota bacterium]